MGNRRSGRKFVPTVIKRRQGGDIEHDASREPRAPVGRPPMPTHVASDPVSSAAFATIGDRLLVQGVLTEAHGELLAVLADAWAGYQRMHRDLAALNFATILVQEWNDHEGKPRRKIVENPLCRQLRQQALLLNTLFGEFGQTPASAPKVTAAPSADPFEDFLSSPAAVVPFPSTHRRAKG